MKVICIDNKPDPNRYCPPFAKNLSLMLEEGIEYTISGANYKGYNLIELPHPYWPYGSWAQERFIPLSEIDETELVNQKVEIYDTGVMGRE